jgi:hypothetical protein
MVVALGHSGTKYCGPAAHGRDSIVPEAHGHRTGSAAALIGPEQTFLSIPYGEMSEISWRGFCARNFALGGGQTGVGPSGANPSSVPRHPGGPTGSARLRFDQYCQLISVSSAREGGRPRRARPACRSLAPLTSAMYRYQRVTVPVCLLLRARNLYIANASDCSDRPAAAQKARGRPHSGERATGSGGRISV